MENKKTKEKTKEIISRIKFKEGDFTYNDNIIEKIKLISDYSFCRRKVQMS